MKPVRGASEFALGAIVKTAMPGASSEELADDPVPRRPHEAGRHGHDHQDADEGGQGSCGESDVSADPDWRMPIEI